MIAKGGNFSKESATAEEMAAKKFGRLRMKHPEAVTAGSGQKVLWLCDCGKEAWIRVHDVYGKSRSCGRCSDIPVSELFSKRFGKLQLVDASGIEHIPPSSHKKLLWRCSCGRESLAEARYVLGGTTSSCGHCKDIPAQSMAEKKFGRLRMKHPELVAPNSNRKTWWLCDCGREAFAKIFAVTRGGTKSCGKCSESYRDKWEQEKDAVRALRTPIPPGQVPDWLPQPEEPILKVSDPFRAKCPLCKSEYFPRWSGIRLGASLTCGCSMSRVSKGQSEIASFIRSLGVDAATEHQLGDLSYDVWVPSASLAIEFNGLKWHSKHDSRERDIRKWKNALACGAKMISIFEDEWVFGRKKVEEFLRSRLGLCRPKAVRSRLCEFRKTEKEVADEFLEKFHYIGAAKAPENWSVFFEGRMVACASFKRPTRQSSHDWELVRMASDPSVRVHGAWSKILALFAADKKPRSIVSFSDNRLFDGGVYGKIGFKLDGDVRPDYYWCKGNRRRHKSALRKTAAEKETGKTEVELREAQGYRRIWDLGKKRWVWTPKV